MVRHGMWLLVVCCVASSAVDAAVLERLYVQTQVLEGASVLPGFNANDLVRDNGQRTVTTSPNGNFVGAVNTDPTLGNGTAAGSFYLFGSTDRGDSPHALRREGTLAGRTQETFLDSSSIDNQGNISYVAEITNTAPPPARVSSLWENDSLRFVRGDSIATGPLAAKFFDGFGGLFRTPGGETRWVSGLANTSLGTNVGSALFSSINDRNVLLQSGDAIGTQGTIVAESGAISSGIRWSDLGTNYFTYVDVEPGFTETEALPVLNGQPLFTPSGGLIRQGQTIPALDGGLLDEVWETFTSVLDVNESGDYVMAVFTSDAVNDSAILHNGVINYREGQVVDGITLSGQVQGVAINDLGDIAHVWNDTLFINDTKIAGIGTLVDTDRDGSLADETATVTNAALDHLEITNLPAAGGEGLPVVYWGVDVAGLTTYVRLRPATSVAGDYNFDGVVDGADYTAWRDSLGSQLFLAADGDASNIVDAADYEVWRAAFGSTTPPLIATVGGVPEPSAIALCLLPMLLWRRRQL